MITHYEGRGGHSQVFDSCVIVQIDEINEVKIWQSWRDDDLFGNNDLFSLLWSLKKLLKIIFFILIMRNFIVNWINIQLVP